MGSEELADTRTGSSNDAQMSLCMTTRIATAISVHRTSAVAASAASASRWDTSCRTAAGHSPGLCCHGTQTVKAAITPVRDTGVQRAARPCSACGSSGNDANLVEQAFELFMEAASVPRPLSSLLLKCACAKQKHGVSWCTASAQHYTLRLSVCRWCAGSRLAGHRRSRNSLHSDPGSSLQSCPIPNPAHGNNLDPKTHPTGRTPAAASSSSSARRSRSSRSADSVDADADSCRERARRCSRPSLRACESREHQC